MVNRVFSSDLSTEGLNRLIGQLNAYSDELDILADEMVQKLAEIGITVAEYSVYGDWRDCIEFKYEPMNLGEGELVGRDTQVIHRVWYTSANPKIRKERKADVSPILMSEYGAGWYALDGHRGTFPNQHNAFKSEWFWYDESGNRYSSEDDYHMIATQPMYRALVAMMEKATDVAKEVFSSNGNG